MKEAEDKFAKKIISYMEKEPAVSVDVAIRLEFSRNMALNAFQAKQLQKEKKKLFSFDFFRSKTVWAGSFALALLILFSSTQITQSSSYTDEISYHVEADTIPIEVYSDEI